MEQTPFILYSKTHEAWEAMLSDCEHATVSIDIEQYIFDANQIGKRFIEILTRKALEGVKIRMLIDTAGSYYFYRSTVPDKLRALGIKIRFFNIISPWRIPNFFSWFFRNHKKTLVIDGKVGFTGGTGIGDHMRDWRDTTGRVEGKVVSEITASFEDMWLLASEKDIINKVKLFGGYKERSEFVANAPYFQKRFLYHAYMKALKGAQKSIHITNSYFIPDRKLTRILKRAARKGIDVKIIVPDKMDVVAVSSASHSSFAELLKAGVKIYRYSPAILHAKVAVVDGVWGTYGSFNLDSLSFRYNYEGNIMSYDKACAATLEEHFEHDIKHSKEVTYEEWKKRPLISKIRELIVYPVKGLL